MNQPVNVLIVEDSEDDAKLILRALRRGGFDPTHRRVQTAAELESALKDTAWDAVFSDFNMPGFSGMDALRIFRSTGRDIPFVLISGTIGEEIAVDAMKAGASDYVMKQNLTRLAPALKRELQEAQTRAAYRRAQDALTDSETRFRALIENASDITAVIGQDGSISYTSPSVKRLAGYEADELMGKNILEFIHADDAQTAVRDLSEVIRVPDGAHTAELRYRHKDGSWRVFETLTRNLLADPAIRGIVANMRDITERKHATQLLRESEARFRSLTEMSSDFYWESDAEHRLTTRASANRKPSTVSTFERGTQIGERRWEIPHLSPDEAGWQAHRAELDAHRPFRDFLLSRLGSGGTERHISISGDPVFDASGEFKGYRGVGTDITERKAAEAKIIRLNRVYAILTGINSAIVRIRERGELFRETCRIAVSEGGFALARVIEFDANGHARIAATSESDSRQFQRIVDEHNSTPEHTGILAAVQRYGQPLISNDVAADPRIPYREALTEKGNYALALLPFLMQKRVAGAILLRTHQPGMFDEAELRLLLEFVSNLSFALEHMEEEAKVRRLTRVYAVLSGINSLIVRARDRDALFQEACRIAVDDGHFMMAWIGIVDRSAMKIVPIASAGAEPEFLTHIKDRFSLRADAAEGNTMAARAVREKKAIVSNDIREGPKFFYAKERMECGILSIAVLPLIVSDDVVGTLTLYAGEINFFDEEELKLLTELAGDIAFAIDHIDKQERLDYLAYYDALTGLANRSLFLERVAQYIRTAVSDGHKLALFLIDLERFKNINDSLGRPAGDALLRQVAAWMTRNLGDANLLARVGADHFAVVLPEVRQDGDLTRLLEKSMAAFVVHPFCLDDTVLRVAVKLGAALFPDDGADADTLFRNAEAALKKAKASGERFLFYTQKMTDAVAGKLTLENQLHQALEKEEFVLHYQPKVNLATGKLTGAEALIRWNDPRTGLVPPGRFIPILEETGLIYEIGRWALRKAIEDYLRWRAAGLAAVRIAVNVSPLQLRNRGFIAEVSQAIGIDAAAPAGLEIEITESLIMADIKLSIASLRAIRALGVTVAIDDFGTGFSSLSYLARLPVDTLKIDRSFVTNMTAAPEGLSLVSTIINLAHSLKLKVVAEGVETEEQSRLLRLLSCDEMQGFLFSKPVPVEIFETKFLAPPLAG